MLPNISPADDPNNPHGKRWNLPNRAGWVYADKSEDTPVMSLTLVSPEDDSRRTLTAFGAEYVRHLADIFAAAADFIEGGES